ncbi:MAG: Ig-like domain-containing protein, partial [Cellvibrionaceae bacterium]|nr:Ig-like domain-containing protein [Cellvibrionaceae bacterium]
MATNNAGINTVLKDSGASRYIEIDDGDGQLSGDEIQGVDFIGKVNPGDRVVGLVISDGTSNMVIFPFFIRVDQDGNVAVNDIDISNLNNGPISVSMNVAHSDGSSASYTDTSIKVGDYQGDISIERISTDTGIHNDFITADTSLTISGSLDNELPLGSKVQVKVNDNGWVDAAVDGLGWSFEDGKVHADGDVNYQVRVIDQAGNVHATETQIVTVDTIKPGADPSENYRIEANLGAEPHLHVDQLDAVSFTAKINVGDNIDSIRIEAGGKTHTVKRDDISVDAEGNVSIASQDLSALAGASINVTMSVTDGAGNQGEILDSIDVVGATPIVIGGEIHRNIEFRGWSLELWDGETKIETDFKLDGTSWSITLPDSYGVGTHNFQLWWYRPADDYWSIAATTNSEVIISETGYQHNYSYISSGGEFDLSEQTSVSFYTYYRGDISIDSISDDTGIGGDFITSNNNVTLNGSLDADLPEHNKVQVSADGSQWSDAVVNGRNWVFAINAPQADGEVSYQVRVVDQNGSVRANDSQRVTVDTVKPGADPSENYQIKPDLNGEAQLHVDKLGDVSFSAQLKPGDKIDSILIEGGGASVEVSREDIVVDAQGNVRVSGQDLSSVAAASITVTMNVTDLAGNRGAIIEDLSVLGPQPIVLSGQIHESLADQGRVLQLWDGNTQLDGLIVEGNEWRI